MPEVDESDVSSEQLRWSIVRLFCSVFNLPDDSLTEFSDSHKHLFKDTINIVDIIDALHKTHSRIHGTPSRKTKNTADMTYWFVGYRSFRKVVCIFRNDSSLHSQFLKLDQRWHSMDVGSS